MPQLTTFLRHACALLLLGTFGCSSDLVLPAPDSGTQVASMVKLLGDKQTGPVGEQLRTPLVVEVITERQEPAGGVEVTFEVTDPAGGTVSPTTAVTNSDGQAVAHWTLGIVPGSYTVTARLVTSGADTGATDKIAEFQAAAQPGPPDTLSPLIPLEQPGVRERPVNEPPRVRVVDRYGNPVAGIPVAWQVTAGEGRVTSPITTTDSEGNASVDWILGNRIGVHKLTAAIESATGSPVVFLAKVFL